MNLTLRIVTLDNLYRNIENPLARQLFDGLMKLRAHGYGPEYPDHYIPLETTDFVARHHLFCTSDATGLLTPIAGFRTITLGCLDYYHLKESHLAFAEEAHERVHYRAISEFLDEHRRTNRALWSANRVTIAKEHRGNKEFSMLFQELVAALGYADCLETNGGDMLGSGVFRFKTNLFLGRAGFVPLRFHGEELPQIKVVEVGYEPVVLMSLERFSDWTKAAFEKHQLLLRSRLLIQGSEPLAASKRRAA